MFQAYMVGSPNVVFREIPFFSFFKWKSVRNGGYSNQVGGEAEETYVDFDGDGKTGVALYRKGAWHIIPSSTSVFYGLGLGGILLIFQ